MSKKEQEPRMISGGTMVVAPRPEMAHDTTKIVVKPLSKEQKAKEFQDKAVRDTQGPYKKPSQFSF